MNFLAHAMLSGGDEDVITGNFIADRVKGKAWENYPARIKTGILLHRSIDEFTDSHEVNRNSSRLLQPYFGKYSSVVTDVMNDHLLAIEWSKFHHLSLEKFINFTYQSILKNEKILPDKSKMMLPYMIQQDWLGSYIHLEGIADVLKRMSKRTPFESGMEKSLQPLTEHFEILQKNFQLFFPELIIHSQKKLTILSKHE
jgi:acyl carrier protein phosphodiesterase